MRRLEARAMRMLRHLVGRAPACTKNLFWKLDGKFQGELVHNPCSRGWRKATVYARSTLGTTCMRDHSDLAMNSRQCWKSASHCAFPLRVYLQVCLNFGAWETHACCPTTLRMSRSLQASTMAKEAMEVCGSAANL